MAALAFPAPITMQRPLGSLPAGKIRAKHSGTMCFGSATANAAAKVSFSIFSSGWAMNMLSVPF
jgi:hypothetical protein